ncbi:MAG TPA: helix-turn-helix domain-containing protein [Trebonia sp.]
MTVGKALAEARTRAGLSVDEVSERTRIREKIIRGIELDDYEACGGDLFARGYVRVIADIVGVDAQPLIREYDQARQRGAVTVTSPESPGPASKTDSPEAESEPDSPEPALETDPPDPPDPESEPDTPSAETETSADEPVEPAEPAEPVESVPPAELFSSEPVESVPPAELFSSEPAELSSAEPVELAESAESAPAAESALSAPTVIDLTWAAGPDAVDLSRAGSVETVEDLTRAESPAAVLDLRRADLDAATDLEDAPSSVGQATSQAGDPAATTSLETPDTDDEQGSGTTPGYELAPPRIQPGPRLHPSLTRYTWRSRFRDRRRELVAAVLAIVVLVVIGIAGMHIFSSLDGGSGASTTDGSGAAHQAPAPRAVAADPAGVGRAKDPAASAPARHKHAKAPRLVPVRQLPVSLAEAFGPNGPADGDNPDNAMNTVRPGAAGPWTTQWYATATFGQLKSGTGLLLDMGRTVAVTRAAINLGAGSDADLQLRAGNEVGNLHAVTSAAGVGGDVVLRLHEPVRARYLLVWFTQLPSAANGQYQASIYHITIDGRP